MIDEPLNAKARLLRSLHDPVLVLPSAWDAVSARWSSRIHRRNRLPAQAQDHGQGARSHTAGSGCASGERRSACAAAIAEGSR